MLRRFLANFFCSPSSSRRLEDKSTLSPPPPLMVTTAMADGRPPDRFVPFDFCVSEEDCRVEGDSAKILSKFTNVKSDPSPITKYNFLQFFANGTNTKKHNEEIFDVDAGDNSIEAISGNNIVGRISPSKSSVNLLLDNDDDIESISSTSAPDLAEDTDLPEYQVQGNDFGECVIDSPVVVSADFIIYGDVYSNKSQLTFSCSFIKVEGTYPCGPKGPFSFKWAADDIINIEWQWCEMVQTARVSIHFKLKADDKATDSSDVAELTFSVFDPNWLEKQKAIKSLNVRYRTSWNLDFDNDTDRRPGFSSDDSFFTNHSSSNLCELSEEFIYPRGDPGAVSLSKMDIDRLKPQTFINDTIIDFYAKYLESRIHSEERHRFHFLNCFFFRKLADLDKDVSEVTQGRDAFRRVSRWTRKLNIFEKDYIFLPVNFSLHWSLIVICHPGEVPNIADEDLEKLSKVPCILHMDSLKGSHRGLANLIQSYLWEEWKERQKQPTEITSSLFLKIPFISLELPQQENFFDCGLFLLHYMECFINQAPSHFNPFKNPKSSNFLRNDWFQPAEASRKRAHIKKVIHEIAKDHIQKIPPTHCCDRKNLSALPDSVLNIDAELLHAICDASHLNHTKEGSSSAGPETEMSNSNDIMNSSKEAMVLCDLSEQKPVQVSPIRERYPSFEKKVSVDGLKGVMSPIEEVEESCESANSLTRTAVGQPASEGILSLIPSTFTNESKALRISPIPILMMDEHKEDKTRAIEELLGLCHVNVRDQSGSSSSSKDVFAAYDVMDSEDKDSMNVGEQSVSSTSSDDVHEALVVMDSEDEEDSMNVKQTEKEAPRKHSGCIVPKKEAPCCPRQEEHLPLKKRRVNHRIEKSRVGSGKCDLPLRNIVCIKDTPRRPIQEEQVPAKERRRVIDIDD